jgi:hypothetical protein
MGEDVGILSAKIPNAPALDNPWKHEPSSITSKKETLINEIYTIIS